MKIGVVSDTHDRLPTFARAVSLFKRLRVDAVFHAGDYVAPFAAKLISPAELSIPTHCIYGNNDGERKGLKAILPHLADGPYRVTLGGKVIVMHHFLDWLKPADYRDAHLVISGHDHKPAIATRDGKLFLNPGECCGWLSDRCTAAIVDLDAMAAQIVDVHE